MPHARTTVRDAVAALLMPLGHPVTIGRVYPDQIDGLPSLALQTLRERRAEDAAVMWPGLPEAVRQARVLVVEVEIRAGDDPDGLTALDDVALEVERAVAADPTLGGLVKWLELESTEVELSGDLESPVGLAVLSFEIFYRVNADDPSVIIA